MDKAALSTETVDFRQLERAADPRRRDRTGTAANGGEDHLVRGPSEDDDRLIPAKQVWLRYGVTSMTLFRWLRDDRMQFPAPVYLGRLRYWRLRELQDWEQSRPRRNPQYAA